MRVVLWIGFFLWVGSAAGAEIVENGMIPKGRALTLEFTTDLRFGADEDGDEYLWDVSTVKVLPDDRGHMFIIHLKERQILEFDVDGKFLRIAARDGQGPGELQGPISMAWLPGEGFAVLDAAMMSLPIMKIYDQEMNFISQKMPMGKPAPLTFIFSPTNKIFGAQYMKLDLQGGLVQNFSGIMDREFNVLKELSATKLKFPPISSTDSGVWGKFISKSLKNNYLGGGAYSFGPNGEVFTAVMKHYEITRWDPELKRAELIIRRKYKPIPMNEPHLQGYVEFITESMKMAPGFEELFSKPMLKRAVVESEPPPVKRPIFGLIAMEDGGLLVIHEVDMGNRENLGDLFSKDGTFLGQVGMPNYALMGHDLGVWQPRMVFRGGFAYTIMTDDFGDHRAYRLKYRLVPDTGQRFGWVEPPE